MYKMTHTVFRNIAISNGETIAARKLRTRIQSFKDIFVPQNFCNLRAIEIHHAIFLKSMNVAK